MTDLLKRNAHLIFLLCLLLAASGLVSTPIALLGGILFGLFIEHPLRDESSALAKTLLKVSVVALGFGTNLHAVGHAGSSGFLYTAVSITGALALGLGLGKVLSIGGKASFLIASGTAICGGSAIAAIAPITEPSEEEISVSMGTVFLLNSVALVLFPLIGHALHLSQNQFGLWSALAIHDTSSVVGAAASYGKEALAVGTTVKLARALWIIPVSLLTAVFMAQMQKRNASGDGRLARIHIPWFIGGFCLAAAAGTFLPRFAAQYVSLSHLGKAGLTATLFLIGTSFSRQSLRQVGGRPLLQGVLLWVVVAGVSLFAIFRNYISI